ncbi:MAG: ABC transporter permease, partial [Rudaea sp.]
MNIWESTRIALNSLGGNKMRAGLTMLGIIIGVAAVIALVSIGQGAQAAVTSQISSIGTNLLFIRPGSSQQGGVRGAQGSAGTLTLQDAQALGGISGIQGIAPEVDSFGQVVYQGANMNARVLGVTPDYANVTSSQPSSGDFIQQTDVAASTSVVDIGSGVAQTLFGDQDPIGKMIRINNVPFRVVGVMQSKGGTGFLSVDNQVFVPLTTAQTRLARGGQFRGSTNIDVVNVQITDQSVSQSVTDQISQTLRDRHHITAQDDFTVQSQQDVLSAATAVTNTLTLFLGGVAAIALLVGGIGIMNIMLVSVTERTREIGIRKAV